MGEQEHNEVQGIDTLEESWLGLALEDSPCDQLSQSTETDEVKGMVKRMVHVRNSDFDPLERVSITRITHNEIKAMRAATNAAQPPIGEPKVGEKTGGMRLLKRVWDKFLSGLAAATKRR